MWFGRPQRIPERPPRYRRCLTQAHRLDGGVGAATAAQQQAGDEQREEEPHEQRSGSSGHPKRRRCFGRPRATHDVTGDEGDGDGDGTLE